MQLGLMVWPTYWETFYDTSYAGNDANFLAITLVSLFFGSWQWWEEDGSNDDIVDIGCDWSLPVFTFASFL